MVGEVIFPHRLENQGKEEYYINAWDFELSAESK